MAEDIVRVLRIIEYVGPRSAVERQVAHSLHGTKEPGKWSHIFCHLNGVTIRIATIGSYPEIMEQANALDTQTMPKPVPFEAEPASEPVPGPEGDRG